MGWAGKNSEKNDEDAKFCHAILICENLTHYPAVSWFHAGGRGADKRGQRQVLSHVSNTTGWSVVSRMI